MRDSITLHDEFHFPGAFEVDPLRLSTTYLQKHYAVSKAIIGELSCRVRLYLQLGVFGRGTSILARLGDEIDSSQTHACQPGPYM